MSRRRRSIFGSGLFWLCCVVAVPLLAVLAVYALFDPNDFKPRIAEAVRSGTGRDIALDGPIGIVFSLSPTLKAEQVRLSNPPGFSRPDMARLAKVEAKLALWPLLRGRVEIVRLSLTDPDLLLETDAAGQSNWRFTRAAPPQGGPSASPANAQPIKQPGLPRFAISEIRITNGTLTWRNQARQQNQIVSIRQFLASAVGPNAPMSATADLSFDGHAVAVTAETGPLEQLFGGEASVPGWPMQVVARVEGVRLAASGSMERPLEGRGYQLNLDATSPDLGFLGQMLGRDLPALRDVSASAKLRDGTGTPLLSGLMIRAGASDLASLTPGLSLDRLQVTAAGLDQPAQVEVDGVLSATKLHGTATVSGLAAMATAPSGQPLVVDATIGTAGASLNAKGSVVLPRSIDLAVTSRIPDLAALSPLVGSALPALKDLVSEAALSEKDGDLRNGVVLRNLKVTGPAGDLTGELSLGTTPRPSVRGQLASQKLDVDAVLVAWSAHQPLSPVLPAANAAPPSQQPPVTTPVSPAPKRLFPEQPFDLAPLGLADVDLRLGFAELRFANVTYRDVSGRIDLNQGFLVLDPVSAMLPGGKVELRMSIDTKQPEPAMTLAITAPGIAVKPVLGALGLPDDATGTVELTSDLTATGRSPHALAASLAGRFGLAMTDGELDNRLLARLVDLLRVAKLPTDLVAGVGGRTRLRCFATRIDAVRGVANVSSLVLDTGRALVQGGGVINLGDEILGLRLRPLFRSGSGGVVLPVRLAGNLRAPTVSLDSGGALEGIAGNLAGNLPGLAKNPFAALSSALAGERGGDACGPAVAAARSTRPAVK